MRASPYRLVVAAAVVVAPLLTGVSVPAEPTPSPTPTLSGPELVVQEWLDTNGPAAVAASEASGLSPVELAAVTVGSPVRVHTWNPAFTAGNRDAEPLVELEEWVAPLLLEGTGLGVIVLELTGEEVVAHRELWDRELGRQLPAYPGSVFLREETGEIWFRLWGDYLAPVSTAAREVLAGSIQLEAYRPLLIQRLNPTVVEPVPEAQPEPAIVPVLITGGVMLLLLVVAAAVVWIRQPEGNE